MKFTSQDQITQIGQTIRAVAQAEAKRFFKAGRNDEPRTYLVYSAIREQVFLALYDLGLTDEQLGGVEPHEDILRAMLATGYTIPPSAWN